MKKRVKKPKKLKGQPCLSILRDPLTNKGTAFTKEERDLFHLEGRIPYHCLSLEEQVEQQYQNFKAQTSEMNKYRFLFQLQDDNEVLFFKLVSEHISEMLPFIYTPTVGQASLQFSSLYRSPRGLYLAYPDKDKIQKIIHTIPQNAIDVIVITDGERILGLGDLGIGGMAICIGKLCLYTLFGGITPEKTLPVLIDVGTNSESLLKDPLYLGWRHLRIRGENYQKFIHTIVDSLKKKYPQALLHWEDFGKENAPYLLEKYRNKICSFNDDIQGTAAVVLAAALCAIKKNRSHLHQQRIVVFGAGSAGIGICHYLLGAMIDSGLSKETALSQLYVLDVEGLVHTGMTSIPVSQRLFARKKEELASWKIKDLSFISLSQVVKEIKPTILIGVSTVGGAFTEDIIEEMARYVEHPIIFPLSNPTSRCEAHAQDLIRWTKGQAIIATGSPYDSIIYEGKKFHITQCNNVYIFPGIGLGAIACKAKYISEKMFYTAARVLSAHASSVGLPQDELFPPFEKLAKISKEIAIEVIKVAQKERISSVPQQNPIELIESIQWDFKYRDYTKESAFS